MIKIDYTGCGVSPIWLRQDYELLFNLIISKCEIVINDDHNSAFFSRMKDEKLVVPIRVGDYRNISYCRAKTRQLSAHVPSLQAVKLSFTMQGTRINVQFRSSDSFSTMEIRSGAEIECNPYHVFLLLNFAGHGGVIDLTPEWDKYVSISYADKFYHLYEYLRDGNHFTDKNGKFIEMEMPTMRSFVFRKDGQDIFITPENLLESSKTFSARLGSFVHIKYTSDDHITSELDLYFNPRNLKYGEPKDI